MSYGEVSRSQLMRGPGDGLGVVVRRHARFCRESCPLAGIVICFEEQQRNKQPFPILVFSSRASSLSTLPVEAEIQSEVVFLRGMQNLAGHANRLDAGWCQIQLKLKLLRVSRLFLQIPKLSNNADYRLKNPIILMLIGTCPILYEIHGKIYSVNFRCLWRRLFENSPSHEGSSFDSG